ncbi:hypothetical protein [Lacisediminihabitans sp. H27-G8]|uniref:hypothetical protein n=1 Tax=Lacisediminihabitans sp. H27-G8 TaxID=3111909 RepID=UPI0038FC836E
MMIASSVVQGSASALVAVLAPLPLFQIALVAGAPLGRFAWRGEHRIRLDYTSPSRLERFARVPASASLAELSLVVALP